jgi:hypothetical protein
MHRNQVRMCDSMAGIEPRPDELPPRRVRAFVVAFLGAFLLCGLFGLELWPLTGWRLFSQLRTDHQVSWQATAVREAGETQVRFAELPRTHRNFPLVMRTYSELPRAQQIEACRLWLEAAQGQLPDATAMRIYRIDWYLSHGHGPEDGPPPTKTLLMTCDDEGAADASR